MERIAHRPVAAATAAMLGAGIIAAAPICAPSLPAIRSDSVVPLSLVDDLLYGFSTLTDAAVGAVTIPTYAVLDSPFFAAELLVDGVQKPSLTPSLLSFALQRYLNPQQTWSWPFEFRTNVTLPVLGLLPAALSTPIVKALVAVNTAISTALTNNLPDADPGNTAWEFSVYGDTVLPRLINGVASLLLSPIVAVGGAISWVGRLPVLLYRTAADAIANPSDIPGLLSNLVFQTIGLVPTSLAFNIVEPFANALITFPPPFGTIFRPAQIPGWAQTKFFDVIKGWNKALGSLLPKPVIPPPASAVPASAASSREAPKAAAAQRISGVRTDSTRARAPRSAAARSRASARSVTERRAQHHAARRAQHHAERVSPATR